MQGRIVFVNSFKGGAGKTTFSLMHCISGIFQGAGYQESCFENVVYMDLDILGTGTCYLFDEKLLTQDKSFERTGEPVKVPLQLDRQKGLLYVAYLDPKLKIRASFGEEQFVSHQAIATDILKGRVTDFIRDQFKKMPDTLLVVDCAPGFSELEQEVLEFCYDLAQKEKISVEEYYVATLDAAHIRKCIEGMKDIDDSFSYSPETRSVHVVINDMQNYMRYVGEVERMPDPEGEMEKIVAKVRLQAGSSVAKIHLWRYLQDIALRSVYSREQKVENHTGDYLFTGDNYRDFSAKRTAPGAVSDACQSAGFSAVSGSAS